MRESGVDREVLGSLSENDLKDMGVTVLGHRRKLLTRIKELLLGDASAGAAPAGSSVGGSMMSGGVQTPITATAGGVLASACGTPASIPVSLSACLSFATPQEPDAGSGSSVMQALEIPPLPYEFGGAGDGGASARSRLIQSMAPAIEGVIAEEIMPAIDNDEAARREKAEAEAVRLRIVSTELTADVQEKMQAEDFCINEGQWCLKKMLESLRRSSGWAIPKVQDALLNELSGLESKMKMPGCSIVTVGDTGAGKSTLLNALLGETSVLPTNGMRACTASIIEMSFNTNPEGDPYVGEVEFVTRAEWEVEFDQLLDDLTQQDGKAILTEPAPNAPSHPSWCKLYSIFGTLLALSLARPRSASRRRALPLPLAGAPSLLTPLSPASCLI